tara:strand:+ start:835 stop:1077 length:243 start_codon:yes stop_codon:yes gene_type:complete
MTKINTIYDNLRSDVKKQLRDSATKYDSAKRLKYRLMSSTCWHDLTVGDVSSLMSYAGLYSHELTSHDLLYGTKKFLKNE